jgi:hypothetical protein
MASGQLERAMGERAVASCERAERSRGEQRREQTERGVGRGQGKTGAEGAPTPPLAADAADATGNGAMAGDQDENVEGDPAVVAQMTVDDDDAYLSRSVKGQAVPTPPPPVALPDDHPLRELVTAILEGRVPSVRDLMSFGSCSGPRQP